MELVNIRDLCLQVFNIEFNINLVKDFKIKDFVFDLADKRQLYYVEIFQKPETDKRNIFTEKIEEITRALQRSQNLGKHKRFELLIVFEGVLNEYERKYYSQRFPSNSRFSFRFFDFPDIRTRAKKRNIPIRIERNELDISKDEIEYNNKAVSYWWINTDKTIWDASKKRIGDTYDYPKFSDERKRRYLDKIGKGDLLIGYEKAPSQKLTAIYQASSINEEQVSIELILKLESEIHWSDLNKLDLFISSEVHQMNANGSAFPISKELFYEFLKVSSSLESFNALKMDVIDPNPSTIANYTPDTDFGNDYLNFSPDIEAFAKVITSKSFNPPLAIALFGKWGAGKSFFMEKLKDRIQLLSKLNNSTYCSGVAQIHFNAWSYMDTNLWASIVDRIFSELNIFINKESQENEEDNIRSKLEEELSLLKDFEDSVSKRREDYEKRKNELLEKKRNKESIIQEKIDELKSKSFKEALSSGVNYRHDIENAVKGHSDILSDNAMDNPDLALHEFRSNRTFIYYLFKEWSWLRIFSVFLIVSTILILPQVFVYCDILESVLTSGLWQLITAPFAVLIPVLVSFKKAYKVIKPITASLWEIKRRYDDKTKEVIYNYEIEVKTLELEVEQLLTDLRAIESEISTNQNEIEKIEYKIEKGIASQALYSFIERRANNIDYQKHLGLISLIRKDFKKLSRLFIQSKDEQEDSEFLNYFKTPLQRIVLYIDDLDRCPANKVIEVLEAVNLLMSFPLFVVVVGVDPRWVKNALLKEHNDQFSEESKTLESIDVLNYLEKIFQIPFHLKQPSDSDIKSMINNLTREVTELPEGELPEESISTEDFNTLEQSKPNKSADETLTNSEESENDLDQYLALKREEVSLIGMYSSIIGSNPRAIKRFINVYQIIRAHRELRLNIDRVDRDFSVVVFLLSLPIGSFKSLYPLLEIFLQDGKKNEYLISFLESNNNRNDEDKNLKMELLKFFKNIDEEYDFSKNVTKDRIKELNDFVRRFTFSELF